MMTRRATADLLEWVKRMFTCKLAYVIENKS